MTLSILFVYLLVFWAGWFTRTWQDSIIPMFVEFFALLLSVLVVAGLLLKGLGWA